MIADSLGFDGMRRLLRICILLDAAEVAGLGPLAVESFHLLAYFGNVLAPVWDLPALDGKLLKRNEGPFYPGFQRDLDRAVGLGIVRIGGLSYVQSPDMNWKLQGSYSLNRPFSAPILSAISTFPDEASVGSFVRELAYAFSALEEGEFYSAGLEDATYSDPFVDTGEILDFGEWRFENASVDVTQRFDRVRSGPLALTRGEKTHFYVRQLHQRATHVRS